MEGTGRTCQRIHRVCFPQTERVNYIRVACVNSRFRSVRCQPSHSSGRRLAACFAAINPSRGRPYASNSILIMNFSAFKIEFYTGSAKQRGFLYHLRIYWDNERNGVIIRGIVIFFSFLDNVITGALLMRWPCLATRPCPKMTGTKREVVMRIECEANFNRENVVIDICLLVQFVTFIKMFFPINVRRDSSQSC